MVEELADFCRVMRRCAVLHEAHVLISINVMKTWNQSSFQNFKVPLCIHRVPEDHRTYERVNCDSRSDCILVKLTNFTLVRIARKVIIRLPQHCYQTKSYEFLLLLH